MEPGAKEGPRQRETVETALDATFSAFNAVLEDLQKRDPVLFNPPTKDAFEQARGTLPWPLNQKDGTIYFRLPPIKGQNNGLQITWEDATGLNVISLGHSFVHGKKPLGDRPIAYYEGMSGERIRNYSDGMFISYDAGTLVDSIPMETISVEKWKESEDAKTLEAILGSLREYSASLPPVQGQRPN